MDAETVAGLLGVSTRQLNNYINMKELPSQGSGRRRTFVWAEVREWYVQYRIDLDAGDGNDGSEEGDFGDESSDSGPRKKEDIRSANLRKTRAEADLKQMALSKLRGELINIADARTLVTRTFSNLRGQLLNMAPKLSTRLAGEPDLSTIESIIREEMETLCRELSTGAIVGGAPEQAATEAYDGLEISAAAVTELSPRVDAFLRNLEASVQEFLEDHASVQP
jgi:phage terminase Nu1 subunit (DNA packaging protein)